MCWFKVASRLAGVVFGLLMAKFLSVRHNVVSCDVLFLNFSVSKSVRVTYRSIPRGLSGPKTCIIAGGGRDVVM